MVYIKIIGIALVIGGCGVLGLNNAWRVRRRVEELKNLRVAMHSLENEITCLYTPLSRALSRCADIVEAPARILFAKSFAALNSKQGITAAEAWNAGVDKLEEVAVLEKEDIKVLRLLSTQIGMSNVAEQKKLFNFLQAELQKQEKKAAQKRQAEERIFAYGGFLIGMMIAIILI